MNQTIVDLTKPETSTLPKPIVLAQCLQDSSGNKHFSGGDFTNYLRSVKVITRLATLKAGSKEYSSFSEKECDVIMVDGLLFLGQWNDGVVA